MKTLCIIRHAKASHAEPLQPDRDRPLAERGKSDAALMGMRLLIRGLLPDMILASSAQRTRSTAAIIARELALPEEKLLLSDELYDGSPHAFRSTLAELPDDVRVAFLVGHNPEVTQFSEQLSGRVLGALPTCSVVCVDLEIAHWEEMHHVREATLRFLEMPRTFRD
jgi:phosphohistidine phosphatase